MNTHPQKQHKVPQLVLRNFCLPGAEQLHVFDKKTVRSYESSVRDAASERYYYDLEPGEAETSAEYPLSNLEGTIGPIIQRILESKSIAWLTHEDRAAVALFLSVQFSRTDKTPEVLLAMDRQLRRMVEGAGHSIDQVENYTPIDESNVREASVQILLRDGHTFIKHFLNKAWLLMEAPPTDAFLISDHPIGMTNHLNFWPYGNLGLGVTGIQVYFPLSAEYCLAFYCPTLERQIRENAQKLNLPHYANYPDAAVIRASIRDQLRAIVRGTPARLASENVTHINSLLIRWATRFVYSRDDNFGLAREMIAKGDGFMELKF